MNNGKIQMFSELNAITYKCYIQGSVLMTLDNHAFYNNILSMHMCVCIYMYVYKIIEIMGKK